MTRGRLVLRAVILLLVAGCSAGPFILNVGEEPQEAPAPTHEPPMQDGGSAEALEIHLEDRQGREIEAESSRCAGDCVDVQAIPEGGYPPYTFRWEDGSTSAKRRICPGASAAYQVAVTDHGVDAPELDSAPQTVRAAFSVEVRSCTQEVSDAGPSACAITLAGQSTANDLATVDPEGGTVSYFRGGATLPAGKYRVEYVDGCMRWGPDVLGFGWTIHANANHGEPGGVCQLVGATHDDVIATLPGVNQSPGYATYDACVAANRGIAPLEFDFAGGKLGAWVYDVNPAGNLGGEGQGACGVSPTWRLIALE
ncbi:MAG: hypothetical protein QM778_04725 [Myxococcales bacterium]